MELYIARHGETDWNKAKKIQGRADIEMNEAGNEQVERLTKGLQDILFDAAYASPLKRAVDTAKKVSGKSDIIIDERLYEINFGELEGRSYKGVDNISQENQDDTLKKIADFFFHPQDYVPAPGGESFVELVDRAGLFLEEMKQKYKDETVLVVSHSTCINGMLAYIRKSSLENFWSMKLGNCAVSKIVVENNEFKIALAGKTY